MDESQLRPDGKQLEAAPPRMGRLHADAAQAGTVSERLRGRERQLQEILSLSPEAILALDFANQVTFHNQRLLSLFGIELKPGEKLDTIGFMESIGRKIDLSDASGLFKGIGGEAEGAFRLASPVKIIKWETHQLDDPVLRHILFFRDVTKETEIDRIKSEFLATAAHELRTPMSSIYGFVELLLTRDLDEPVRREYLGIIYDQTKGLIRMLGELLDLARIEARAGRDFNFCEQELWPAVCRVVTDFKMQGDPRKIQLGSPGRPSLVSIDRDKIGQALLNVLSNAHKYSMGENEVEVGSVTHEDGNRTWTGIRVRDYGMGMTPEQLSRIFERFYRADNMGQIPGTGLGMSLVKEIMQIHGGRVDVASVFGKGTEVTLWLPIVEREEQTDD